MLEFAVVLIAHEAGTKMEVTSRSYLGVMSLPLREYGMGVLRFCGMAIPARSARYGHIMGEGWRNGDRGILWAIKPWV